MATWPVFTFNPDITSQYGGEIKNVLLELSDGFVQRVQDGINNEFGDFRIDYKLLSKTDFDIIYNFVIANKGGEAVTVPNFVLDPDRNTDGTFFILSFITSHSSAGNLFDMSVLLREVAQ